MRTAATDESIPPDSPQITGSGPTCFRMEATVSSMNEAILHLPEQPQISNRKFRRMSVPLSVCTTSGWNCTPRNPDGGWTTAAFGQSSLSAILSTSGPSDRTESPWLIQTSSSPGNPAKSASEETRIRARPYSRDLPGATSQPSARETSCIP